MIRVFYGDDRVKAQAEIRRILGDEYEVIEGAELTREDLPNVFLGMSLLADKRAVVVRDGLSNKEIAEEIAKYVTTPHEVILFEMKLDKRGAAYKALKDAVEFREFKLPVKGDFRAVFNIYNVAKTDGARAVKMLRAVQAEEEPIMFVGLLASQALKDFAARPMGVRERRRLKELAKIDLAMKSTKIDPWLIVESFLLMMPKL